MPKQRKIKHYSRNYLKRKKRRGRIWKVLLFVLLLVGLIFLGYCGAKSLQQLAALRASSSTEESSEPSIEESTFSENSEESSELVSSEPSQPERQRIRATVMPRSCLFSAEATDAFLSELNTEQYNTVVVDLKDEEGLFDYATAVPLATSCGAIREGAISLEELTALGEKIAQAGFTPAARMYALRDDYASHARYNTSYLFENQDITWLDRAISAGGRSWLNPYMEETVQYLADLAGEISKAGFTEIFTPGVQYPDTPYLQQMGYGANRDSMSLQEALANVINQMNEAAAANGGRVLPIFAGECYLGESEHLYGGSPNSIDAETVSPALIPGREAEILEAITLPRDDLIPQLTSEDQLPVLNSAGIDQYIIG